MSVRAAGAVVAITHALAAAGGYFVVKPGRGRDGSDMDYLAAHADRWTLAWFLFVVAAFGMVWMMVALARRLATVAPWTMQVAVVFTVIGAAVESAGHCLSSALPWVDGTAHVALARAAELMASAVAAVAFSLGMAAACAALRRARAGAVLFLVGGINAVAGGVMAAASLLRSRELAEPATMAVLATVTLFGVLLLAVPWSRSSA
jgi:hypothetical protein